MIKIITTKRWELLQADLRLLEQGSVMMEPYVAIRDLFIAKGIHPSDLLSGRVHLRRTPKKVEK